MNVIKTERASMHTDTLSGLREIHIEKTSLADFLSDDTIQIIMVAKCSTSHRINHAPRECLKENQDL